MKIALVYAFKDSFWFSCTKITANLRESYKAAYGEEQLASFDYDLKRSDFDLAQLAESIHSYAPDKIVFLDHNPHPLQLISFLAKRKYSQRKLPEIIIHVFGCFSLHFQQWKELGHILKENLVKFFCASDRQVNFVRQFFEDRETYIKKVPFPVNSKEFYYQEEKNEIKHKLGIDEEAKIILYTGRLSLQKRIIELLDIFVKAHQNRDIPNNTYLILAGKFDSFAFNFGHVFEREGEYFRTVDRAMGQYPKEIVKKIILLGNVKNSELQKYYSIADLFVSFSTYHDEDYGMSVAEAGACGCPLLLTDWAGFSSFKKNDSCQLIKTHLTRKQPEFDQKEAYEKLVAMIKKPQTVSRTKIAQLFAQDHSIESVSKILKDYLSQESLNFIGFNSFLDELAYAEKAYGHVFYNQIERKLNDNYLKTYETYVREY